jgi:hypothetical protein
VMSGAVVRGDQPTWGCDDRWSPAPSALHAVSAATGNREWASDQAPTPGSQNGNGLLTGGPGLVKSFSNFQTPLKIVNSKKEAFPYSRNI